MNKTKQNITKAILVPAAMAIVSCASKHVTPRIAEYLTQREPEQKQEILSENDISSLPVFYSPWEHSSLLRGLEELVNFDQEPSETKETPRPRRSNLYDLGFGSFKSEENAQKRQKEVRSFLRTSDNPNYQVNIHPIDVEEHGLMFRVCIDGLSLERARLLKLKLKPKTEVEILKDDSLYTAPGFEHKYFNKNFIMSDEDFFNKDSLTLEQIQNFLDKNKSCLKDYREKGKLASQVIYDTSQETGITPKFFLSRLQVEQGLITKQKASKREIQLCMGYGAMDHDPHFAERNGLLGFDTQLNEAGERALELYNEEPIDLAYMGVDPLNQATYLLYRYTNHTGETNPNIGGNELVWMVCKRFEKLNWYKAA